MEPDWELMSQGDLYERSLRKDEEEKDWELRTLVKNGVINPEPVFNLISFHKTFGSETDEEKLNHADFAPAYARRVEELL